MTTPQHKEAMELPPCSCDAISLPDWNDVEQVSSWIETVRWSAFWHGARHGEISTAEARALVAALQSRTTPPVEQDKGMAFPMLGGPAIPWKLAEIIRVAYGGARIQKLDRIAERGGFGWAEVAHLFKELRRKNLRQYVELLDAARAAAASLPNESLNTLFAAIAHGDDEHRTWLKEAIDAHFAGKPVPPPTGKGTTEARLNRAREALAEARQFVEYYPAKGAQDKEGKDLMLRDIDQALAELGGDKR